MPDDQVDPAVVEEPTDDEEPATSADPVTDYEEDPDAPK